jgi:tyrosine-protein kinase Etk/Wzc
MQSTPKTTTETNLFLQLWSRYFPYWPMFILLLMLGVSAAWFYLRYVIPVYESTAVILIKDEKKGLDDSKMLESFNLLATKKIIENEIEILRSRSLMTEVVKKLHLYAPTFEEGKLVTHSGYLTAPLKVQAFNTDSIKETDKIYFTYDPIAKLVSFENRNYPIGIWSKTPHGILMFSLNNQNADLRRRYFFKLINPKKIAESFIAGLNVLPASKLSTVINLKIRDQVPDRGEDILNELISTYNKAMITDKNTLAVNTLAFVEDRLSYITHDLDSIEQSIQRYRSQKGIVDISEQGKIFLETVSGNDQKLSDINMQLAILDKVEKYVVSKDSNGSIVPSTLGIDDALLGQLLEKLYNVELEYEKQKKTVGENNPKLLALQNQIIKMKPSILENINSRKEGLIAGKKNLTVANSSYNSMLQSIPQQERELIEISREQTIKNSIYSFLLQKREEAALSHSSTVADSRIVDNAQSTWTPVSPNKKLFYIISILAAVGIGVLAIAVSEIFNRTILFRHEIESYTRIPILGEIGHEKSGNPIVIGNGENTLLAEQFRRIRAALNFLGISEKRKKILVTSTISGEGKSFFAVNLALSLAMIDKKVALVEFDFSNPTLGVKLGQQQTIGVADYLMGDAEPEDIIRRVSGNDNLFFLAAGSGVTNPSELIMSKKVNDLLKYLNDIFDFVVIDSAPSAPSSDAYVLSPLCDATLYMVRHKYTPKVMIQRLDENIKVTGLKNMAIIFNGIRSRGFQKDIYGYGYGNNYVVNKGQKGLARI